MPERSGGSETYDSCEETAPKAAEEELPKAEDPNAVEAARALLACAFALRLLMAGFESGCDNRSVL